MSLVFIIIYWYVSSVGNFVQLLLFRLIVDASVRRGSDSPREVKKILQKVHETPTYRPMGLIRERDERSVSGYPNTGRIFTIFQ